MGVRSAEDMSEAPDNRRVRSSPWTILVWRGCWATQARHEHLDQFGFAPAVGIRRDGAPVAGHG